MDANLANRIRKRAYEIWFAAGCRDGEAQQHWLTAEREILEAAQSAMPARRAAAKKVTRRLRRARPKAAAARAPRQHCRDKRSDIGDVRTPPGPDVRGRVIILPLHPRPEEHCCSISSARSITVHAAFRLPLLTLRD